MLYDKLDNILNYGNFPKSILKFISELSPDINFGRHEIDNGIYANVETYSTKELKDACFEAHENYIDIQILLKGNERIYYRSKKGLEIKTPYDSTKDIAFYSNKVDSEYITLDGTNFVILFPLEAHAPQVCDGKIQEVIKVVIKVRKDLLF